MVQHSPQMTSAVMKLLQPEGRGLEIAPYFDPFLLKGGDLEVYYTDYISTEEIRAKAAYNPGGKSAEVPAVDFVWVPGKPLAECAPSGLTFDYAAASHVMEHVPNPIGWLNEILAVLNPGGRLALFLPDRRRNVDIFRNLTSFGELVGLWITQPAVPTPHQILDFMTMSLDGTKLSGDWSNLSVATAPTFYSDSDSLSFATSAGMNGTYVDIHATVWEPEHCVKVLERVVQAGLLNVAISSPEETELEFAVVLTKLGEPASLPPPRPKGISDTSSIQNLPAGLDRLLEEMISRQLSTLVHRQEVALHDIGFAINQGHETALKLDALAQAVQRLEANSRQRRHWSPLAAWKK